MVLVAGALFSYQFLRAKKITIKKSKQPLIYNNLVNITLDDSDQIYGNPGAPMTAIEFVDLSCSECLKIHSAIKKYAHDHPQSVRLVWKDAPKFNFLFKKNELAHRAAYCAGKQGKFWEYLDAIIANKKMDPSSLNQIANQVGIEFNSWTTCLDSDETVQKLAASVALAQSIGADSLPALFINNRRINTDDGINIEELLKEFSEK